MIEFCVDIPKSRAHFKFNDGNDKYCLEVTKSDIKTCGSLQTCGTMTFSPVACGW